MPLEPGTALGPYAVTAKIGEGGMGEMYSARDTKLDRDVALKVLPQAFTDDPDRLARFEREAKVLASLNHPNIAETLSPNAPCSTRDSIRPTWITSDADSSGFAERLQPPRLRRQRVRVVPVP